jgi:endonuclease/exonuclease/phosphatase family metal-dependent hydrolase
MTTFSLLTLNCYGVPTLGTSRRLSLLANTLNRENLSAVCLQEVQSNMYRRQLVRQSVRYPESAYERFIHAPKGGLLTLSSQPINNYEFVLYEERGLWYTPALADWILHKGMLITRLLLDDLPVVLVNTHLTANYTGDWSRSNPFARHEHNQLQQLAYLVQSQPLDALVIVCGDFNIPRGSWLYESFLKTSGLCDPLDGDTQPTLHHRWVMPSRYIVPIDFALLRAPHRLDVNVESRLRFQDHMQDGDRQMRLSDHCGVELRLSWESQPEALGINQGVAENLEA